MALSFLPANQILGNMVAKAQSVSTTALNFTTGSVLRALYEGATGAVLWLQYLIALTLQRTRLATSTGADVDSFGADFGFSRLGASPATGTVTFSRFTATNAATIPVGATVKTTDGTQSFAVVADTSNSAFVAATAAYTIPAGAASLDVPVQATVAGTGGNVLAATVGLISSQIIGVDSVTNAGAFTGGADAESDQAFRDRFDLWLPALARSTPIAVESAAGGVQLGVTVDLIEGAATVDGPFAPAFSVLAVDDGSGHTSADLLSRVQDAVNTVRGVGMTINVVQATVDSAAIALTVSVAAGATASTVKATVQSALTAYVNALPVSAPLSYFRLAQVAFDASSLVTDVTGVTLNGGSSDMSTARGHVVRVSTVAVS